MPEITLSDGSVVVIDEQDADLMQFKWSAQCGASGLVYATRSIVRCRKNINIVMSRLILERIMGRPLLRLELTDHRDTNSLNNRRYNLRLTDTSGNGGNRRINANNQTGYKGVSLTGFKDPNKQFRAQCAGEQIGTFPTAEEAHAAYCRAAYERWGEFANFGDAQQHIDPTPSAVSSLSKAAANHA